MSYDCWSCGATLTGMILPVSRREECAQCGAEIHCCHMCVHFDRQALRCREERAEEPASRDRANFCDYFAPSEHAFTVKATTEPPAELKALFGDAQAEDPPTKKNPLDDLFK